MTEDAEFEASFLPLQEQWPSHPYPAKNGKLASGALGPCRSRVLPSRPGSVPRGLALGQLQLILTKVLGGKGSRVINPCGSFAR